MNHSDLVRTNTKEKKNGKLAIEIMDYAPSVCLMCNYSIAKNDVDYCCGCYLSSSSPLCHYLCYDRSMLYMLHQVKCISYIAHEIGHYDLRHAFIPCLH